MASHSVVLMFKLSSVCLANFFNVRAIVLILKLMCLLVCRVFFSLNAKDAA